MKTFNKTTLGLYLGVWHFNKANEVKYYEVTPEGNFFLIKWGKSVAELEATKQQIKVIDPTEVYNRILSKARGGFKQISSVDMKEWNNECYLSMDCISERLEYEYSEYLKRKPRKRKLSLLEWMDGLDEYREDESL